MPREGYTNLSVEAKEYDKIRRTFDRLKIEDSFAVWTMNTVTSSINRLEFLEKAYPNIKLISIVDNGLVLEDIQTKTVAKVFIEDNSIKCSVENNQEYIQYAVIHPEFRF